MPVSNDHTAKAIEHADGVKAHHDYTAGLIEQLMGLMAQLADIVGQLSAGHQAMGEAVSAHQAHSQEMHAAHAS